MNAEGAYLMRRDVHRTGRCMSCQTWRMLKTGITSAAFATALLLFGGTTAAEGVQRDEFVVIAHAGGAAMAPANTVAAVRVALQRGADVIENDIQRTADHRFVVFHDRSLERFTDVEELYPDRAPWLVEDFTLAEVRRLNVGWAGDAEYGNERIPTLVEWARAVGEAGMLIEAKDPGFHPHSARELARELRERPVFRRAVREDRLVVMSFNHRWMKRFDRQARHEVATGLTYDYHPTTAELREVSRWVEFYVPHYSLTDEATVDLARRLGMQTYIWTLNVPQEIRLAVSLRADGLITDMSRPVRDLLRRLQR